jgi:hypothetical protein
MRRVLLTILLAGGVQLLCGCRYEKVISQRNILSGIQGAESQIPHKQRPNTKPAAVFAVPEGGIRQEDEDGNITLYTKSFGHLMTHIAMVLENDEKELFIEQVLSQVTKDEFVERDLDPGLAFDELKARQREVFRLFHFMPMGEYTPGMVVQPVGRQTFRLALDGGSNRELRWIGIDAVFERGNYRLRWFVNNNG